MYTLENSCCLTCYKHNTQYSPPEWAVLGGPQGELRFSEEAERWQFDTSEDPRSPRPVQMDIMPWGSGVCLGCYENINSEYRKILGGIMPKPGTDLAPIEEESVKANQDPKNTSWLWPRTPSGWKLVVRQRAFSNDICSDMQEGVELVGKRISWFSATTTRLENGLIDSYDIKTRLCNVTRGKGSHIFTRNLRPSTLFPPNATEQCTDRCYCPTCVKPKCCIFCQTLCHTGVDGPGQQWYCRFHPVEKFFVPGSANKFEVLAWMKEDNHRRGETLSIIDTESSIGIAVYGSQKEVTLAECEGASIAKVVNVLAEPAKKDMCHECKVKTYLGRICPSTGDSNWYCDGCWDKYWLSKEKYSGNFPSLS